MPINLRTSTIQSIGNPTLQLQNNQAANVAAPYNPNQANIGYMSDLQNTNKYLQDKIQQHAAAHPTPTTTPPVFHIQPQPTQQQAPQPSSTSFTSSRDIFNQKLNETMKQLIAQWVPQDRAMNIMNAVVAKRGAPKQVEATIGQWSTFEERVQASKEDVKNRMYTAAKESIGKTMQGLSDIWEWNYTKWALKTVAGWIETVFSPISASLWKITEWEDIYNLSPLQLAATIPSAIPGVVTEAFSKDLQALWADEETSNNASVIISSLLLSPEILPTKKAIVSKLNKAWDFMNKIPDKVNAIAEQIIEKSQGKQVAGTPETGAIETPLGKPSKTPAAADTKIQDNVFKSLDAMRMSGKGGKMVSPDMQAKYANSAFEVAKDIVRNKPEELPKTVQEAAPIVQNLKSPLYAKYMEEAKKSGAQWVKISTQPVIDALIEAKADPKIQSWRNGSIVLSAINDMISELSTVDANGKLIPKEFDPVALDNIKKTYNQSLDSYYRGWTSKVFGEHAAEAMVNNMLGELLDRAMAESPYADLKSKYGNILAIEKDLNKQAVKLSRRKGTSIFDLGGIQSVGDLAYALANPTYLLKGIAEEGARRYLKYRSDPNTYFAKLMDQAKKAVDQEKIQKSQQLMQENFKDATPSKWEVEAKVRQEIMEQDINSTTPSTNAKQEMSNTPPIIKPQTKPTPKIVKGKIQSKTENKIIWLTEKGGIKNVEPWKQVKYNQGDYYKPVRMALTQKDADVARFWALSKKQNRTRSEILEMSWIENRLKMSYAEIATRAQELRDIAKNARSKTEEVLVDLRTPKENTIRIKIQQSKSDKLGNLKNNSKK